MSSQINTPTTSPSRRTLLVLTEAERKERLRHIATVLQEPSLNIGLCPHPGRTLVQYDKGNANDGRTYKYVRISQLGCGTNTDYLDAVYRSQLYSIPVAQSQIEHRERRFIETLS